jgi:predicted component of type VI protein secretion system
MRSFKSVLVLVLASFIISGCASSVKRKDLSSPATPATFISQDQPAGKIAITLTPEAKKDLADNIKFDQDEFKDKVVKSLTARSLLNESLEGTESPTIEIEVEDIRVRSTLTAAMFGFMAGNDSLTGRVMIKDPSGKILDEFTISASYALGGAIGGQDSVRLDWLYEEFAEEMADELTHS